MTIDEDALLIEANRINYRLRSTFFYRKLKEYNTLNFPAMVTELLPVEDLYNWDERAAWGIGEDAYNYIIAHSELHLFQIFCHPKLIREYPRLLAYYRNIAVLSQKAVKYLTNVSVTKIEKDIENRFSLSTIQALALAKLFNEHTTLIIDNSIQSLTKEELYGILLTSTGTQIDGSWRNAIGEEAEKVVQRLLINEANERKLLAAFIPRSGTSAEPFDENLAEEQLANIDKYRGCLLKNGTTILFSSDPDISLFDSSGKTVCAIEVKGGADPAGALERYGAAKKSFEKAKQSDSIVYTIMIASCITNEVHNRIKQDPLITSYYNLSEVLIDESAANDKLMNEIFSLLGVPTDT